LYVDEDAIDRDLVRGLRSSEIDVMTAAEADMILRTDEEHLTFATMQGRALYSFNVGDFHEIHAEWTALGAIMPASSSPSRSGTRPANRFGDFCA
jgi:hypothetical protein